MIINTLGSEAIMLEKKIVFIFMLNTAQVTTVQSLQRGVYKVCVIRIYYPRPS